MKTIIIYKIDNVKNAIIVDGNWAYATARQILPKEAKYAGSVKINHLLMESGEIIIGDKTII